MAKFETEQFKSPSFRSSSITSFGNQRRTSFSNSFVIPDLNIFTTGPGAGKYSGENSLKIKTCVYTIPKAERPLSSTDIKKTPG